MGDIANLKPFKKGHKKMGGRKKGTPNNFHPILAKAALIVAERHGIDGKGTDGLVGFLRMVWHKYPKLFLTKFLSQRLKLPEEPSPARFTCRLDLLADEERKELQRLLSKAKVHLRFATEENGSTSYEAADPRYVETLKTILEAQQRRPV